ncbi:uroporphyrinogen decarboxylase [Oceanibium sediminis]|uniref:uroporphyrinogen decarboxylase n=1 Tax=Oceanibium sediminis TaxID=2026339 RepID=UPI000DD3FE1E|nr:uroporphyrinogen decarboxylase [Oceanibium sediminis]
MQTSEKTLMRALAGESLPVPPVWMMRQAGRYLPEYRATRAQAGSFLELCYNPELAAEVTLQPIRRYGFDASILFADILLVPQALGADLWFVEGEGPRLSTITSAEDYAKLKPIEDIHETLAPVYETVRILSRALPQETTLIGFAGAPWTVATYMIAGRGTKDQGPARKLMYGDTGTFDRLMDKISDATAEYLIAQIEAGAEVVKLFDSWAGALPGAVFDKYAVQPARKIIERIHAVHPHVPVIGFPRQAGEKVIPFVEATGVAACGIDTSVDPAWAAKNLQPLTCVQGNLDPMLLVTGGDALVRSVKETAAAFADGPYIFNLGHGITPDADPANVDVMLKALRC